MGHYPNAIWRPTPKHGYGDDDAILGLGICAHSMEGSLSAAFGELDNPKRQASWHFSIPKTGDPIFQHIDTMHISYASGGYEANKRFWSIEHEGKAGEPLTSPQLAATTALMHWLLTTYHLPPIRQKTLWEHREMTQFGSAATACPSGRIPWDVIIPQLQPAVPGPVEEELDMFIAKAIDINPPRYYIVGPAGKRVIDDLTELMVYQRAKLLVLDFAQGELDTVPGAT